MVSNNKLYYKRGSTEYRDGAELNEIVTAAVVARDDPSTVLSSFDFAENLCHSSDEESEEIKATPGMTAVVAAVVAPDDPSTVLFDFAETLVILLMRSQKLNVTLTAILALI